MRIRVYLTEWGYSPDANSTRLDCAFRQLHCPRISGNSQGRTAVDAVPTSEIAGYCHICLQNNTQNQALKGIKQCGKDGLVRSCSSLRS